MRIEEAQLSFVLSDGLSHLVPGEADAIVLAGMGGELIARLLEAGAAAAHAAARIVMQPMGGTLELRRFLLQNGFRIADEKYVLDAGRYYQIILAVPISSKRPNYRRMLFWNLGRSPCKAGSAFCAPRLALPGRQGCPHAKSTAKTVLSPALAHELQGVRAF